MWHHARRVAWPKLYTRGHIAKRYFDSRTMWFRATDIPESKPLFPDWKPAKEPTQFVKFTDEESTQLERAQQESREHVLVGADGLHTVWVKNRLYKPTYWDGPSYKVIRGTWFFQGGMKPVPEVLAAEIEQAYQSDADEVDGRRIKFDKKADPPTAVFADGTWLKTLKSLRVLSDQKLVRGYTKSSKLSDVLIDKMTSLRRDKKQPVQVEGSAGPLKAKQVSDETGPVEGAKSAAIIVDRPVKHLVLCVHGIGQELARRFDFVSFIKDINIFRGEMNKAFLADPQLQKVAGSETNSGVQVLPILWRQNFTLGGEKIEKSFKGLQTSALFSGVNILADVLLDFVMYTEPSLREQILKANIDQMNRVFKLFCQHNHAFAEKPQVSIVGHSLGSIIANDILRMEDHPLEFDVENLFLVGSPVGISSLIQGKPFTMEGLGARSVYNLMRTADPVASRLEPLICSDATSVSPQMIPAQKGTLISQVKTLADELSSISTVISEHSSQLSKAMSDNFLNLIKKAAEPPTKPVDKQEASIIFNHFKAYNRHGRVDFSVPESLDVGLLLGLAAHTTYFESQELAAFVLHELWEVKRDRETPLKNNES